MQHVRDSRTGQVVREERKLANAPRCIVASDDGRECIAATRETALSSRAGPKIDSGIPHALILGCALSQNYALAVARERLHTVAR